MKKVLLLGTLVAIVLATATACTDYLYEGDVNLNPDKQEYEDKEYKLNHPCGIFSQEDFDRVKAKVDAGVPSDPVYASWTHFCMSQFAQSGYTPNPQEILVRGDATGTGVSSENYINACRDAAAAFQLAMRWRITGEDIYAERAVYILNRWADVCKLITANDNNQFLLAGFQGYQFSNAAEMLRDYSGWNADDFAKFKQWMVDVWYVKNLDFLENHGGKQYNCSLHYWSNWDLANMASILSIGILLDDQEKINYVIKYFKEGEGGGCIENMIPYPSIPDPAGNSALIAQNMESGRDQGHATLVVSMSAELCQMAYNIGEDLFGYQNNRMLAMFEYTAKFNAKSRAWGGTYLCTANDMPFTQYLHCIGCSCRDQKHGSIHNGIADDRGGGRPCWDLIYNHYAKVKNLSPNNFYYSAIYADYMRYKDGVLTGDGGPGDDRYGSNSGAFDQVGWGTMMFTR